MENQNILHIDSLIIRENTDTTPSFKVSIIDPVHISVGSILKMSVGETTAWTA